MFTRSWLGAINLTLFILIFTLLSCSAKASKPFGVEQSPLYSVNIATSAGRATPAFVYEVRSPGSLPGGNIGPSKSPTTEQSTSWANFPVLTPLTVSVTSQIPFASARLLPTHAGIAARWSGNTVTFQVSKPAQLAVSFCKTGPICTDANDTDFANPLLIFANPPETNAPDPHAPNVS